MFLSKIYLCATPTLHRNILIFLFSNRLVDCKVEAAVCKIVLADGTVEYACTRCSLLRKAQMPGGARCDFCSGTCYQLCLALCLGLDGVFATLAV